MYKSLLIFVVSQIISWQSVYCFGVPSIGRNSIPRRDSFNFFVEPSRLCQPFSSTTLRASQTEDSPSFLVAVRRQIRRPFSKAKKILKGLLGKSQDDFTSTIETLKTDASSKVESITNEMGSLASEATATVETFKKDATAQMEMFASEAATTMESITNDAVAKIGSVETEVADKAKGAAEAVQTMLDEQRAISARNIDLSGKWRIVVSEEFKKIYDNYLMLLGQPSLVRSVALSIVGMTTEEMVQSERGKNLMIRGHNVRGVWERTLVASDKDTRQTTPVVTADGEKVQAEAWWGQGGTVHISWMRGVQRYGGGDFESKRYLTDNGKTLVCDSIFHPTDTSRDKVQIQWKFTRA